MNREQFLERIRTASAAGRSYRIHDGRPSTQRVGYCGAGGDLVARMAAEVDQAGGTAHIAKSWEEARSIVLDLCRRRQTRTALAWKHATLDRLGLSTLLDQEGIERIDADSLALLSPDERKRRVETAQIGITSATYAIAETGTLAMLASPGSERLASLLPPVHVAVVAAEQILPDLFDAFDALHASGLERLPSNVTLITGPSKTGDIELTLTTGVHGPGEWHVVLAPDTKGPA